jgi:membrane fusion protein (multidrug efflux system)
MYSPIDGRIGEARVKVGNLVGPEAAGGGAYSELATIHQLDPIGVDIRLSSKDLDRTRDLLKSGLAVRLSRPGPSGDVVHPQAGTCYFIDNAVDELTSTFLAKARMPNPGGILLPGEYVKVRMVVGRLDAAVVVPAPAVTQSETGPVVYVVDAGGKVAIRQVEAGPTHDGLRVVSRGLDAGVPVIVEGLQSVRPGLAVKTEPSSMAARGGAKSNPPTSEPPNSDRARVATTGIDKRS